MQNRHPRRAEGRFGSGWGDSWQSPRVKGPIRRSREFSADPHLRPRPACTDAPNAAASFGSRVLAVDGLPSVLPGGAIRTQPGANHCSFLWKCRFEQSIYCPKTLPWNVAYTACALVRMQTGYNRGSKRVGRGDRKQATAYSLSLSSADFTVMHAARPSFERQ